MYRVLESNAFREDVEANSARLPRLGLHLEFGLYPRLQRDPLEGAFYGRHQNRWYSQYTIAAPILVIQVSYQVNEHARIVQMESLDVVGCEPEPVVD